MGGQVYHREDGGERGALKLTGSSGRKYVLENGRVDGHNTGARTRGRNADGRG